MACAGRQAVDGAPDGQGAGLREVDGKANLAGDRIRIR
jgi:hypothetical protein